MKKKGFSGAGTFGLGIREMRRIPLTRTSAWIPFLCYWHLFFSSYIFCKDTRVCNPTKNGENRCNSKK